MSFVKAITLTALAISTIAYPRHNIYKEALECYTFVATNPKTI